MGVEGGGASVSERAVSLEVAQLNMFKFVCCGRKNNNWPAARAGRRDNGKVQGTINRKKGHLVPSRSTSDK